MNKAKELDRLVGSMEELLARLPDDPHPEMAALRARVDKVILDTWTVVARERKLIRHPWWLVSAGAGLAGSVAFFAGKAVRGRFCRNRS